MEITPTSLPCFLISVHSCFVEVTLNFFSYDEILPWSVLGTAERQGLQTTLIQTVVLRL